MNEEQTEYRGYLREEKIKRRSFGDSLLALNEIDDGCAKQEKRIFETPEVRKKREDREKNKKLEDEKKKQRIAEAKRSVRLKDEQKRKEDEERRKKLREDARKNIEKENEIKRQLEEKRQAELGKVYAVPIHVRLSRLDLLDISNEDTEYMKAHKKQNEEEKRKREEEIEKIEAEKLRVEEERLREIEELRIQNEEKKKQMNKLLEENRERIRKENEERTMKYTRFPHVDIRCVDSPIAKMVDEQFQELQQLRAIKEMKDKEDIIKKEEQKIKLRLEEERKRAENEKAAERNIVEMQTPFGTDVFNEEMEMVFDRKSDEEVTYNFGLRRDRKIDLPNFNRSSSLNVRKTPRNINLPQVRTHTHAKLSTQELLDISRQVPPSNWDLLKQVKEPQPMRPIQEDKLANFTIGLGSRREYVPPGSMLDYRQSFNRPQFPDHSRLLHSNVFLTHGNQVQHSFRFEAIREVQFTRHVRTNDFDYAKELIWRFFELDSPTHFEIQIMMNTIKDYERCMQQARYISNVEYVKVRELGRGCDGVVMEIEMKQPLQGKFAMKRCRQGNYLMDRFVGEIITHQACMGKNFICQFYGYRFLIEYGEPICEIFIEFVSNGCMAIYFMKMLQEKIMSSPELVKFFAITLLIMIKQLREAGIIHRDIKDLNVLLDSKFYPKLTDFGGAMKMGSCGYIIMQTPSFSSPEKLLGKCYDYSDDSWAYGIMLYLLQYGVVPYKNLECMDKLKEIAEKEIEIEPFFGQPADDLIRSILARDPKVRLSDVYKIKQDPYFDGVDWDSYENKIPISPMIEFAEKVKNVKLLDRSVKDITVDEE